MSDDNYLPNDIIYNILSYENLPRNRRVNRRFDTIERSLNDERVQRVRQTYASMVDAVKEGDWNTVVFMVKNREKFDIGPEEDLMSLSLPDLKHLVSLLSPPKMSRQEALKKLMQ